MEGEGRVDIEVPPIFWEMAFSPSPLQSSDDSAYLSASPSYGNSIPQTSPAGISELEQLQKQNELLLQINDQLTREKTQLQIDAELHRRQTDQNQQKQARDDQALQDLQSQIESLHRDLSQKEYELSRMAAKLLDYKQRIDGVELQLRKYSIKKVNSFFPNRDVDLIVTKVCANSFFLSFFAINFFKPPPQKIESQQWCHHVSCGNGWEERHLAL